MKKNKRMAIHEEFDDLLTDKKDDKHEFCEVTEWTNGEGIDVSYHDKMFYLTWTEFEILKKVGTYLYEYEGAVEGE